MAQIFQAFRQGATAPTPSISFGPGLWKNLMLSTHLRFDSLWLELSYNWSIEQSLVHFPVQLCCQMEFCLLVGSPKLYWIPQKKPAWCMETKLSGSHLHAYFHIYRVVQKMSARLRGLPTVLEARSRNLADVFWTTLYLQM